ncbi:MAG: hypothetical protein ACTHK7_23195 [Aureliella sp.]
MARFHPMVAEATMSEERENSADPMNSPASVNPYQAPAYHSEDTNDQVPPSRRAMPGNLFWIVAGLSIVFTLVVTAATNGAALPLLLAAIGGTIRAVVIFERQGTSTREAVPAELLFVTSTIVTMLLLISCAVAFVAICAGGVLTVNVPYTSSALPVWTLACGTAVLVSFVFVFIQSTKWSV